VKHDVPTALTAAIFAETKRFLGCTAALKSAVDKCRSFCQRGFEPMRARILEEGAPTDLKESFYIGPELSLDDSRVVALRFNHEPNLWPSDMPGFRPPQTQRKRSYDFSPQVTSAGLSRLPESGIVNLQEPSI